MPPGTEAQGEWIGRVLGVAVVGHETARASSLPLAIDAYRDAMEEIDGQIGALQAALKASDDSDLHEIAEFGLNALTANHKVKLQAVLMGLAVSPSDAKAAAAAIKLVDSFTSHIAADERIAVCDSNPFNVSMSIRGTLTPALGSLKAALQGVSKAA